MGCSIDTDTRIYQQMRLDSQTMNDAPAQAGPPRDLSIEVVTMQALGKSLFRGQITNVQAQIRPGTTEGALTMCEAGTRHLAGRTWSVLLRNLQRPR